MQTRLDLTSNEPAESCSLLILFYSYGEESSYCIKTDYFNSYYEFKPKLISMEEELEYLTATEY
jgi:hypothetical protein